MIILVLRARTNRELLEKVSTSFVDLVKHIVDNPGYNYPKAVSKPQLQPVITWTTVYGYTKNVQALDDLELAEVMVHLKLHNYWTAQEVIHAERTRRDGDLIDYSPYLLSIIKNYFDKPSTYMLRVVYAE